MSKYEDYAYNRACKGILAIKNKTAADIYALSFYFDADDDDERKALLSVGYNTNACWRACTPASGQKPKWPIASSSDEAKWNHAFWIEPKGEICSLGLSRAEASLRKEWIHSLGLWWTDEQAQEDFESTVELGHKVMDQFVELCVVVAKRLHDEGVITRKFGRPIPILVHELEYNYCIADATRRANPPGLTREFEKWIADGCR
jgi:hypothetical protein